MRHVAIALACALLLLAPLSVGAEEPSLTDPAGDVVIELPGTGAPSVPASADDSTQAVDLLSLTPSETDETIVFRVAVVSLGASSVLSNPRIDFGWTGGDFALFASYLHDDVGGRERAVATLAKVDRDDREFIAQLPLAVDTGAGTLTADVPKVYLVDRNGRVPGRGDTIELRSVETNANVVAGPFGAARAHDRMPDDESAPVPFVLERGDFTQGHVVVSSPDRVRVSNGGATTFVFQALLRNTAETEDEFALGLEDVPEGWNASVRSPVKVPGKEERTVSVLVSVPFAHEHGGYSSFNLTVNSASDPATQAKMRMGVLHTPIPQPAGHHSELYLHAEERDFGGPATTVLNTAFPNGFGWMNTQAEHADDAAYVTPNGFGDSTTWWIALDPALRLGLDFDLERLGELKGSILGKRSGEAELSATLYYEGPDEDAEGIPLAESDATTLTLDIQTATPFKLTLTPTAESDYIAYENGARMVLVVSIDPTPTDGARMTTFAPQLMTADFLLSLPLNEYHDKLTGLSEAAEGLEIVAHGAVEKVGLPGSVLTYPFTVRNGGASDAFVIDLAGNHALDGIVVPDGVVTLATGETREVTLAVEIPINTNAGEELEVLLFVHGRDDPSKMAIARTKTLVTHDAAEASPDEARLLLDAQARESDVPALGLAVVISAIALAALALGRRRR